jgi:hypothetical protein
MRVPTGRDPGRPNSELGPLSARCISTRIPEKYMPLLDAMGADRARWLRQVIVGALEKLPPAP